MTDRHELTLTLHGLDEFNDEVDAAVFARKLNAFVRGIGHADMAANGGRVRHKLLLTELKKNTATASVREQVVNNGPIARSSLRFYSQSVNAVYLGLPEARDLPIQILEEITKLNKGVGRSFAFGEIKIDTGQVLRIDDFFAKKANRLIAEVRQRACEVLAPEKSYEGIAYGSYDGTLKEVDLRGEIKTGKLILTAGIEIDCTLNSLTPEELERALDRRVTAYGRALYQKSSGLPVRLEITKAERIPEPETANFGRWRGAFRIPEAEEWD
jgi:hypothetical protein